MWCLSSDLNNTLSEHLHIHGRHTYCLAYTFTRWFILETNSPNKCHTFNVDLENALCTTNNLLLCTIWLTDLDEIREDKLHQVFIQKVPGEVVAVFQSLEKVHPVLGLVCPQKRPPTLYSLVMVARAINETFLCELVTMVPSQGILHLTNVSILCT